MDLEKVDESCRLKTGDGLVTDPRRVEELALEREGETWEFRHFLKALSLPEGDLDAIVWRHYEEVAGRIDCRACGNCCRNLTPQVTAEDRRQLGTALDLSEEDVDDRYLVREKGEQEAWTFNHRPCPFLAGNECSVYEARPEVCRSYPHLHLADMASRLIKVVHNYRVCPIVYNVVERLKAELWRPDLGPEDWFDEDFIV